MRKRPSGARGERGTRWNTGERKRETGDPEGVSTNGMDGHERRRGKNERRALFRVRASIRHGAPGPSRLNAVKLSSYSHKGNSLSQPVKYKRVFPAGRFSTPIVFWAGLLFSVAQPRRLLFRQQRRDRSLLLARTRGRERSSFIRATVAK